MRIPLDYYRILGLPIQAPAEQVQQAHRDRSLQTPRRGYSEAAIAVRKQLIDEAYAVLSIPERRRLYDEKFLTKAQPSAKTDGLNHLEEHLARSIDANRELSLPTLSNEDPHIASGSSNGLSGFRTSSIEIKEEQLVGALLILLELGEYDAVLRLGQPVLNRDSISFNHRQAETTNLVRVDIVLTVAVACLELGREQWQQGQYENAAISLNLGQDLLLKEGVFAGLRGEIQTDLYKLRPYRILELLALPENQVTERRKGLQLLRDMLRERGGIDGSGNDQSGLSIDDFLRFIQQLRSYLTAAEQQTLFEEEARRPSAVATYLAAYALIARGFADYQPALIHRASQLLSRLSSRQDVYLENAVCALLLGQTQEASQSLELSQERESIAFIQQHSQDSPDLLPGLCLYSERWLEEEVFPQFRDLANRQISLKGYFADGQVQTYLENLPDDPVAAGQEWFVMPASAVGHSTKIGTDLAADAIEAKSTAPGRSASSPVKSRLMERQATSNGSSSTATIAAPATPGSGATNEKTVTKRVSGQRPSVEESAVTNRNRSFGAIVSEPSGEPGGGGEPSSPALDHPQPNSTDSKGTRRPARPLRSLKLGRLLLVTALGLIIASGLGYLAWRTYGWLKSPRTAPGATLQGEQPMVRLTQPPIAIPDPDDRSVAASGPVDQATADVIIQAWLSAKSDALGAGHLADGLKQILTEPILGKWQKRAAEAKQEGWHWKYKHSFVIKNFENNKADNNRATIEAEVNEAADLYEGTQLNRDASYNTKLLVRYGLKRQNQQWRIDEITVLR